MDNLRLILLIIGCLFVMGIYLWEIFRSNPPNKRKTDILNAVDEIPEAPVSSINANKAAIDDYTADALADLGSLLAPARDHKINFDDVDVPETVHVSNSAPDIEDEADELPLEMSVKDYEASMEENDEPDIFAAIEEDLYGEGFSEKHHIPEGTDKEQELDEIDKEEIPESNKSSDDLLVLYITSPSHITFNGLSISKAADEVGMIYGHMNIFHHFGPGKLHSGQPLFSLANMHEPGSFDLGRMADLKTKGLAIFMYSPASIDASVVFELFLNTAQRLSELLGGTVRTADNKALNNVSINALRKKVESFSINQ